MDNTSKNDNTHSIVSEISLIASLVDSLTNGAALFGLDKKVILTNPAMARMTGLPREGFDLIEFIRLFEKDHLDFETAIDQVLENRETIHIQERRLFRFFFEIFIAPVINSEKEVVGGVIILHDVSYYQREKELLDSVGDGVIAVDRSFNITFFNKSATAISGWPSKEVMGKPFREVIKFIREKDRTENITFIEETMLYGEIRHMKEHTVLITKEGREIYVADTAAPVFDSNNKVTGAIIVFRDVSKEIELENARTDFISIVTHQLKGPPSVIKGYIELMAEKETKLLSEDGQQYVKEISAANKKMIELANALLSVFRIDFGTFAINPEPTDLIEVSDAVIGQLMPQIEKKKIRLEKKYDTVLPIMHVDSQLTHMIISNLLSNAVKYTPEAGSVTVAIERHENEVRIAVADTGYGIPKDQQSKLFGKFFRANNVLQNTEGTGLGLYIVKSAVEQSGGKIWFESEENKGTTFYVSIPLSGMLRREGAKGLT